MESSPQQNPTSSLIHVRGSLGEGKGLGWATQETVIVCTSHSGLPDCLCLQPVSFIPPILPSSLPSFPFPLRLPELTAKGQERLGRDCLPTVSLAVGCVLVKMLRFGGDQELWRWRGDQGAKGL